MADKYTLQELQEKLQAAMTNLLEAETGQRAVQNQIWELEKQDYFFRCHSKIRDLEEQKLRWANLITQYNTVVGNVEKAITEKQVNLSLETVDETYEEISSDLDDTFKDFQG